MRKEKIKPLIIASALALGTVSVSTSAAVKPKSISLKPTTSIVDIGGKTKVNVTSKPTKAVSYPRLKSRACIKNSAAH